MARPLAGVTEQGSGASPSDSEARGPIWEAPALVVVQVEATGSLPDGPTEIALVTVIPLLGGGSQWSGATVLVLHRLPK